MHLPADSQADGGCPRIEHLWPAAVNEHVTERVAAHLKVCRDCQARIERLMQDIEAARALLAEPRSGRVAAEFGKSTTDVSGDRTQHAPGSAAGGRPSGQSLRAAAWPAAVIGKYLVLETISESGQGRVFRGLHPSLLIEVVIKLAHRPGSLDAGGRLRFVSEARALAEIDDPHLARLYDLGFYEGRPYLVMEYVRGTHLGRYRETADFNPREIALLVAKVARAVGAAHAQGVLHLDMKPENILMTPAGEPVLIDFGLSFLAAADEPHAGEDLGTAGTPQYMSPEQIRGDRQSLSQRTDVFGLGGVLYFLCVGREPFIVREVDGRLQRAAEPDWQSLAQSGVPGRLKTICGRALAIDPDERYASADALAETLEAVGRKWVRPPPTDRRTWAAALILLCIGCWSVVIGILTGILLAPR